MNALQISAKKDMGHGILFAVNYAWSRHSPYNSAPFMAAPAPRRCGRTHILPKQITEARRWISGTCSTEISSTGLPYWRGRHFPFAAAGVTPFWAVGNSLPCSRSHWGTPSDPVHGHQQSKMRLARELGGRTALAAASWRIRPSTVGLICWRSSSPNPYTFGNSGRDILYGPPFTAMAFRSEQQVSPLLSFGEGGSLTFKAETVPYLCTVRISTNPPRASE